MLKKVLGFIMIFTMTILVSCGKEVLNLEDVSFTVNQYFDEEKDLDNSYDLNFSILKDVGEVKVFIYIDYGAKGKDKEKIATFNLTPKEYEKSISFLNQPKGEYRYIIVVEDKDGNLVEKDLIVNVDKDGYGNEENIESENKDNDKKREYKAWDGNGVDYNKGDEVEFEGRTYSCIQDHKSQADWTPKSAVSLWQEFKI